MKVLKLITAMPSPPPGCDDGPHLTSRGFTWEPGMLTAVRVTMATIRMRIKRKKHCKPMMDPRSLWKPEGIVLESVKIGQHISGL
jgi:hypothetical protein